MAEQPQTSLRSPMPSVGWRGVNLAAFVLWSSGNAFSGVMNHALPIGSPTDEFGFGGCQRYLPQCIVPTVRCPHTFDHVVYFQKEYEVNTHHVRTYTHVYTHSHTCTNSPQLSLSQTVSLVSPVRLLLFDVVTGVSGSQNNLFRRIQFQPPSQILHKHDTET